MIRKAIFAAASLLASLSLAHAPAASANLNIKDGSGTAQVLCAKVLTDGSLAECHVILDSTLTQIDPATKQLQQAEISALGTPLQAGGNIVVTGTLPGFASPPTVNLGTLNGAALDSTLQAIKTLLGTAPAQDATLQAIKTLLGTAPLQAGGHVNVDSSALPPGAATAANQAPLTAPGTPGTSASTVTTVLPQVTSTDIGGSFGTTATTLTAANANRRYLRLQVQGAQDTTGAHGCFINGIAGSPATLDFHSLFIPPRGALRKQPRGRHRRDLDHLHRDTVRLRAPGLI